MSIPVSPFYARQTGNEDNSHLLVLRVAEVLAKRYRTSTMQVFNRLMPFELAVLRRLAEFRM
jgi:hypothetical protein